MKHFEKQLHSQDVFRGRILRVCLDTVELEDGSRSQREIVHHHGGAAILPLDAAGNVYMVRQFRYAFGQELLEIPAGKLEPGEDPKAAAIRELEEECGLRADSVTDLGCIYPSVGYDDEIIYLYLAQDLHETASRPDAGEFLTLERVPLSELIGRVCSGTIRDAKTVTAILKANLLIHV